MKTTCAYCGVGCGIRLNREGDEWQLQGDEQHPANGGALCVKGASLLESLAFPDRLLYPRWMGQRIGWEEALDTLAARLATIAKESGPEAIGLYLSGQLTTEDYYVANKLMKGYLGSANVDTNSRLCMSSAVVAHQRAFGEDLVPACYEDLELADLVVLTGANTAWTHPVLFRRLQQARARRPGLRLVVLDPRRTMTAEQGDLHLALKPGSDVTLWNGLCRYLLDVDGWDKDYVAQHVSGFEALAAALDDPAWQLDEVARSCGLSRSDLLGFYQLFARTPKTVTLFCQGINQSNQGVDKANAILNAHLMCGRIGKPGAAPFSMTGQPNAMGGREVGGLATQLAAHMGFGEAECDRVQRFWQSPTIVRGPGHKAVELFEAVHRGEIRALWVLGTNPAVSLPDGNRVREALSRCELLVVSEVTANTDTARLAHLLLPAAAWGEKSGTVTNSERTISRQRAFLPLPGEARPDWWALTRVARRLGFGEGFAYEHEHEIFCEHAALSGFENEGERQFDISGLAGLTRAEFEALEPLRWPVNARWPKGRDRLFEDGRFATPDGRARLLPLAQHFPPQQGAGPGEDLPLLLNSGRLRDQWHTMTRTGHVPRLQEAEPWPRVRMGAASLLALGVREGDLVRLGNGLGEALLLAGLDEGLREGEAFLPMHWTDSQCSQGAVNRLIAPVVDPLSGQPMFKQGRVQARAQPTRWEGLWCGRHEWREPVDWWARRPLPEGNCTLLASWSESPAILWQRLGEQGRWLRLPLKEGWLAVALAGDRIEGILLVAARRPSIKVDLLASLLGTPLQAGGLSQTLSQALAGESRLVCSCLRVSEERIVDAITRQGVSELAGLQALLGCGSNCGTCLPEIDKLLIKHVFLASA
ncbi:nitrate reductase [Aeromonas taiwanensis]|uniref:Nitrate reductase n=1 Tax=Aeromonas taiwanensis TaxID=633417 RepID=A0A5F0K9C7_9GAMM|nr:nitrate reductase [Aeromonas taiwanensis]TFF74336.1 nitrate reductase [Aeromonas taiwanensis]TFF75097.1 nitrate reductase [Aeromonas taiwanensis]TFF78553.1 nitrate reductase [Aeromonas taiwanensis]